MEPGQRSYLLPLLTLSVLYLFGMPLWALIAITIWYLSLLWLEDEGILDKYGISRMLGVVLMVRTKQGQGVLEKVSSTRKFWRGFGEFSIWLCLLIMIGVVVIMMVVIIVSLSYYLSVSRRSFLGLSSSWFIGALYRTIFLTSPTT